MATNMISVTNVPMFAGRKLFIDDPDRVGGDDRPELDLAGIGRAQNAVVGEPGQERLAGLEGQPGDDVAGGDSLDLIPEVRQPRDDVDAEQVQEDDGEGRPAEPGADLDEPLPSGRLAEGRAGVAPRNGGFGHRWSRGRQLGDSSIVQPLGAETSSKRCD